MSFDESGSTKFQPRFFNPLPADLSNPEDIPRDPDDPPFFPDIDQELGSFGDICIPIHRARDLDGFLNGYHGSPFCVKHEEELKGNHRSTLGHYNFGRLFGCEKLDWMVTSTSEVRKYPHIWATMVIDINANERLLLPEALTIVRIMYGRFRTRNLAGHTLAPVLQFSSFGPQHGRILQAHFDGEQMVIFKSKIYDFRHQNDPQAKLFAQWALSEPIGDTR